MPTYYIYSPHSGQVIGLNCYCNRLAPSTCNGTCCNDANSNNCACNGTTCRKKILQTSTLNCGNCGDCCCQECCRHVVVGESVGRTLPLDVVANAEDLIYAYMGRNIVSVKLLNYTSTLVCASETGDIARGILVEAYTGLNASGTKLGNLLYAHIKQPTSQVGSVINQPTIGNPWPVLLGKVPPRPNGSTCYQSTHTHFSIKAEPGVTSTRTDYSCNTLLSATNNSIYSWTV